jgi:gamma-glutamylcyclotransferase (GGCT)/AIG2-like uncharacterized protein YtfP
LLGIMPEPQVNPSARPSATKPITAPACTTALRHVFVYGTLRKGESNDITALQPAPTYVGPAQIFGTLYHLGRYPGVMLGGQQWVQGEVYAISPELELKLDEIESVYPAQIDEYLKREIPVTTQAAAGPQLIVCLVYEINPSYAQGKPVIASGDWVQGKALIA